MDPPKNTNFYSLNLGICPFDNYSNIDKEHKKYGTKINDDIHLNYSVDVNINNEYFNKFFQNDNEINKLDLSYYPHNITQEDIDEDNYYMESGRGTLKYLYINFTILPDWFPENMSIKQFKIVAKMPNPIWYSKIGEYQFNNNPYGNYAVFEMSNYDYDVNNKRNYIVISKIHFYDFSEAKIKEIEEKKLTKYEDIFI